MGHAPGRSRGAGAIYVVGAAWWSLAWVIGGATLSERPSARRRGTEGEGVEAARPLPSSAGAEVARLGPQRRYARRRPLGETIRDRPSRCHARASSGPVLDSDRGQLRFQRCRQPVGVVGRASRVRVPLRRPRVLVPGHLLDAIGTEALARGGHEAVP